MSVRFDKSIYLSNREIREYPNLILVWSSSPVPLSAVVLLLPPSYIASPCRCTLNALLSPSSSRCCGGGGGRCAMFPSPSSQVLPFSLLFLIDFISRLPRRALTGNRTCLCITRQESDPKLERVPSDIDPLSNMYYVKLSYGYLWGIL